MPKKWASLICASFGNVTVKQPLRRIVFYESVLKALEGYLVDKLSIPWSDLSKETIRRGLEYWNVSEDIVEEYLDLSDRCEIAKYAPGTIEGGMDDLYKRTIRAISKMDQNLRK